MEFKDLPNEIQSIAAHTLAASLKDYWGEPDSAPAKELARSVKAAFVELCSEDSAKQSAHGEPVAGSGRMSQFDGSAAMETNSPRAKAWLKIISSAQSALSALGTENLKDTENASINSILEAFDQLGRIPPFPDMRYSLMSEGGYYNKSGEMVIISPKEECASWLIKAVICQPL